MNTKTFSDVVVKDTDEGLVEAVFARFGVKDLDGDVTLRGAFEDGAAVRISAYGHSSWGPARGGASSVPVLPVGKGTIRVTKDAAILDGQFFLDTVGGRETFAVVKAMGDLQEWSYGYQTLKSSDGELDGERVRFLESQHVFEVSPVLVGSGETQTVAVKDTSTITVTPTTASSSSSPAGSADVLEVVLDAEDDELEVDVKAAIPFKSTDTSEAPWDGPATITNLPDDAGAAAFRAAFAWVDPAGDPNTKTPYKFIHHEVADDGTVGAANLAACSAGIAILNGGRGGANIPDADRDGVYAHLAGHLNDAGKTVPELATKAFTIEDETAAALAGVHDLVGRLQALGALRARKHRKEGRVLSSLNRDRLSQLHAKVTEALAELDALIRETDTTGKARSAVLREALRFERERATR